jgi:small-conductance mechanosensitive channel
MEREHFQKIDLPTSNALTEKAMMNMQRNQLARNKASIYARLEDSEERMYEFDPEDIQIIERVFDGQKKLRFEYAVKDELGNRQILVACKNTNKNIDRFLMEGTTFLKIKRVGTRIDTSYYVTNA